MARKTKLASIEDRILQKQEEINDTKKKLTELEQELKELLEQKDELDMRELFSYTKENNISLEQIKKAFEK